MSNKVYISYNHIHKLCQQTAKDILAKGERPDIIIGISGGGLIPARIIRSFLKSKGEKNIPIQAIGLSLYETLKNGEEVMGKEVIRTQWLDFSALESNLDSLIGKKILIIDEVDDTRTTLHYAVNELLKEIKEQQVRLNRLDVETQLSVFVIHNKDKPKKAEIPDEMLQNGGSYIAAETVPDSWLVYPWDADDIDKHTELAKLQGND